LEVIGAGRTSHRIYVPVPENQPGLVHFQILEDNGYLFRPGVIARG
jgi:hypothetical protein